MRKNRAKYRWRIAVFLDGTGIRKSNIPHSFVKFQSCNPFFTIAALSKPNEPFEVIFVYNHYK
jgi:hypothetical protein